MEWITIFYLIFLYCFVIFILVIVPAAFNISLGVRERYVNLLLRIFEVCDIYFKYRWKISFDVKNRLPEITLTFQNA